MAETVRVNFDANNDGLVDVVFPPQVSSSTKGARMRLSSNLAVPSNSSTTVDFDSPSFDTGNYHDPLNPARLTAPDDDIYLAIAQFNFASDSNGDRQGQILLYNGGLGATLAEVRVPAAVNFNTKIQVALLTELNAGDYLQARAFQNTAGNLDLIAFSTWFGIVKWGGSGGGSSFTDFLGDGAASNFVVNHGLGSRDLLAQVRRNSSPYDLVYPAIEYTDDDNITVNFAATVPINNEYRVLIKAL